MPTTYDVSASDTIALSDDCSQTNGKYYDLTASDTIALSDSCSQTNGKYYTGVASDTIALTEQADTPLVANDVIALTDSASRSWTGQRSVTDTISLHESASFVLIRGNVQEKYNPFVGSSSDPNAPTPPTTVVPTLTPGSVVLSYPFTSPTTTITLRRPLFGNRDRLTNQRINRTSRGNTLIVYADPEWPRVQTVVAQFTLLTETQAQDYLTFLETSLGKEIKLTDWEGRIWKGVVLQTDDPVTRDRPDRLTISFTFEGELQ
jgi:hypothetical protein